MSPVDYERREDVAVITMDDGKRNALAPAMIAALESALDRADADSVVPVLTGRPGTYSAGFDLKLMKHGGPRALGMLRDGMKLAIRMLEAPRPVVVACNGDSYAMGLFLVLVGDYRLAARGDYALVANEVAVAFTLPRTAVALCRAKIPPPYFQRTTTLSEVYSPETALTAGIVDEVVAPDELLDAAVAKAGALAKLDPRAYAETKARVQGDVARSMRVGLVADTMDWARAGVTKLVTDKLRART